MNMVASISDQSVIPAELQPVMDAICRVGAELSRVIARGALGGALGAAVGENTDGDQQKALDVMADAAFSAALTGTPVRYYASEEQDSVAELNPGGRFALAIDPLDGSSNIDVNVSIGTIFSIFPVAEDAEASFLRPADEQIAAGYIIYGPQTNLVVTFGDGTHSFVLDPDSRVFLRAGGPVRIPETSREFAINASNYRHWPKPIRAYIDDLVAGEAGPRGANFNMRWIASLVAETHRIMTRGGVFLYPADDRKGYELGRLRMVYECAPIAFLVEQAGGKATNAQDRILSQTASDLHARTPFVFGSPDKVARIAAYHDLPEEEVSALFGKRGLFPRLKDNPMSKKHPIISVTGSSGAGTSTIKHTFDQIFRREEVTAVSIEGDAFHRYNRADMKAELQRRYDAGDQTFSHFSFDANELGELERVFRDYGETGTGKTRHYVHDDAESAKYGVPPGNFTDWAPFEDDSDILFYEGLHGAVVNDEVNLAALADLKIGVVPVINLEWIQKIHRDKASRGYTTEAVTDVILRRMHAYVHCITPQFTETDINFQRVPVVDTSNPFIARWIPTADESLVVIRFKNPRGIDFPYLTSMIHDSWMTRANSIVIPGGKMDLAMQLIFTPMIERLVRDARKN